MNKKTKNGLTAGLMVSTAVLGVYTSRGVEAEELVTVPNSGVVTGVVPTEAPVEVPVVEDSTEVPVVETPVVETPTEAPVVEEPVTETPSEEPVTEEPNTETPTETPSEEPVVEDPTTETPSETHTEETPSEEPTTETPKIEDEDGTLYVIEGQNVFYHTLEEARQSAVSSGLNAYTILPYSVDRAVAEGLTEAEGTKTGQTFEFAIGEQVSSVTNEPYRVELGSETTFENRSQGTGVTYKQVLPDGTELNLDGRSVIPVTSTIVAVYTDGSGSSREVTVAEVTGTKTYNLGVSYDRDSGQLSYNLDDSQLISSDTASTSYSILVDGREVQSFTVDEGTTSGVITLLETLDSGTHTIEVVSRSKYGVVTSGTTEVTIAPVVTPDPDGGTDTGNTGGNTGGNDTGNTGNTGGNTGGTDTGNTGNTGGNIGGTDTGNTGGNTGGAGNTGNTGGNTGNTGGTGIDTGNTGNTGNMGGNTGGTIIDTGNTGGIGTVTPTPLPGGGETVTPTPLPDGGNITPTPTPTDNRPTDVDPTPQPSVVKEPARGVEDVKVGGVSIYGDAPKSSGVATNGDTTTFTDSSRVDIRVELDTSIVDSSRTVLKLVGREQGEIDASQFVELKDGTYRIRGIAKDDFYTLTIKAYDKNGKLVTDTVETFSVNKRGSKYSVSNKGLLGSSVKNLSSDLKIVETNVDKIKSSDTVIRVYINGKLVEIPKNAIKVSRSGGVDGKWKYTYTIDKSKFKEEGVYTIEIFSESETGVNYNSTSKTLQFTVDRTGADISVSGIRDRGRYKAGSKRITIDIRDISDLKSVKAFLNGKEVELEYDPETGLYFYDMKSSGKGQNEFVVEVEDEAGNVSTEKVDGFYISEDLAFSIFNDNNLYWLLGGIATATAGFVGFLALRRKRKLDEEDRLALEQAELLAASASSANSASTQVNDFPETSDGTRINLEDVLPASAQIISVSTEEVEDTPSQEFGTEEDLESTDVLVDEEVSESDGGVVSEDTKPTDVLDEEVSEDEQKTDVLDEEVSEDEQKTDVLNEEVSEDEQKTDVLPED